MACRKAVTDGAYPLRKAKEKHMTAVPGFCASCVETEGPLQRVEWHCKAGYIWVCPRCYPHHEKKFRQSVGVFRAQRSDPFALEDDQQAAFEKSLRRSGVDRHPSAPMVEDSWRSTRILTPITTERDLVSEMKRGLRFMPYPAWD
jgi:hypothetical protein